jgi:ATP-dependent DNA helicase RecG
MFLTKSLLHTTDTYIKKLREAGIETVEQLLTYFPRDIEDKSDVCEEFTLLNIVEKQVVKCRVELITSEMTRNKKLLIKAVLVDRNGSYAEAVWFNRRYLTQQYASGDVVMIYGQPRYEYGKLSFASAEIEHFATKRREIVPVYSDCNYIPGVWIRDKIVLLRSYIDRIEDEIPEPIRAKKWMRSRRESILSIHFPSTLEEFDRAKGEIGYTELFHFQRLGLEKKYTAIANSAWLAPVLPLDTELMKSLIESLPFALTDKQKIVLWQILKDMEKPHAMARMLQGDVGTGKTVVALLASAHAILVHRKLSTLRHPDEGGIQESGKREHGFFVPQNDGYKWLQVAIMAPTEILARQHFTGQEAWLMQWGIRSDLLVGSLTPRMKEDARARLRSGDTEVIFGTHALIQDSVGFARLGFVIVDEQHRFWVDQRRALEEYCSWGERWEVRKEKENTWNDLSLQSPISHSPSPIPHLPSPLVPHRLNMSATPIPRSLALTLYGDQDISVLNEYPAGRKPIHTRVVREEQRESIYHIIADEVRSGRQVYWISPLVEESDTLEIANATSMQETLQEIFPTLTVGLIHGKMSGRDKDRIMREFYDNQIHILSSTSVVEVGVNNPNATIMCIEAAERFGLSQLHQFRGRVGRGDDQSYCYLFTTREYKSDRLRAMESTGDGFELAQIDLELRGPGEVYGVRQSGLPDMHFADLTDLDLISEVRGDIEEWMRWEKR